MTTEREKLREFRLWRRTNIHDWTVNGVDADLPEGGISLHVREVASHSHTTSMPLVCREKLRDEAAEAFEDSSWDDPNDAYSYRKGFDRAHQLDALMTVPEVRALVEAANWTVLRRGKAPRLLLAEALAAFKKQGSE